MLSEPMKSEAINQRAMTYDEYKDLIKPMGLQGATEKPVEIKAMPLDTTLEERGSRYGKFLEHADVTQAIKEAMRTGKNWPQGSTRYGRKGSELSVDQMEALEMIAHKIGRILNGDPDYVDSWTDIAGYAALVEKRLNGVTV